MALTKATYSMINGACFNVLDFGAVGDNATNCTSAFQAAFDAANAAGGGAVYVPAGTYLTDKVTVYSKTALIGENYGSAVVKLRNTQNTHLIYGFGSDALWGTGSGGGIYNFEMRDIVLDGNRTNNTTDSDTIAVVAIYGYAHRWENVRVQNASNHGIWTEWGAGEPVPTAEFCTFKDVMIVIAGRHGFKFGGPRDSKFISVQSVSAGQNTTNTYSGIVVYGAGNGRFIGCHVWSYSTANRMRSSLLLQASNNEFTANHFEGAFYANVHFQTSSNNNFDFSNRVYSLVNFAGGSQMIFEGVSLYNNVRCLFGPGQGDLTPGAAPVFAVQLGVNSLTDNVAANNIDVVVNQNEAGVLYYNMNAGAAGSGQNTMRFNEFSLRNPATYPITGTYVASDMIELITEGNRRLYQNTNIQNGTVSVSATSTGTYIFPFPFTADPRVVATPRDPASTPSGNFWISAISPTQVQIYNNSSITIDFDIIAMKSMTF